MDRFYCVAYTGQTEHRFIVRATSVSQAVALAKQETYAAGLSNVFIGDATGREIYDGVA